MLVVVVGTSPVLDPSTLERMRVMGGDGLDVEQHLQGKGGDGGGHRHRCAMRALKGCGGAVCNDGHAKALPVFVQIISVDNDDDLGVAFIEQEVAGARCVSGGACVQGDDTSKSCRGAQQRFIAVCIQGEHIDEICGVCTRCVIMDRCHHRDIMVCVEVVEEIQWRLVRVWEVRDPQDPRLLVPCADGMDARHKRVQVILCWGGVEVDEQHMRRIRSDGGVLGENREGARHRQTFVCKTDRWVRCKGPTTGMGRKGTRNISRLWGLKGAGERP